MAEQHLARSKFFTLERVSNAKAAPGEAAKPALYKFRANDGDWDRYQDRLHVAGWQLDAFNALKGPILLNHDAGDGGWLGLGRKDVLSLGKARAFVEGDALMVEIEFDPDDAEAVRVQKKLDFLGTGAVSVRYSMKKYHENERGGFDCDEQELLEISVVTIPGNQRALRVKGFEGEPEAVFEKLAQRAADIVVKALDERTSQFSKAQDRSAYLRDIAATALKSLNTKAATSGDVAKEHR